MNDLISRSGPLIPLAIFAAGWIYVTHSLAKSAGWYELMCLYPNRDESAALKLRFQSGWVGSVSMSSVLRFEACPSGLRVGILKLFGLFTRDIFVPWTDIAIERTRRRLWKVAKLRIGKTEHTLTLFDFEANRLARAVPHEWPESGNFAPDSAFRAARVAFTHWLVGMVFIVGFFTVVPRVLSGKWGGMPIEAIEFLAAMTGLFALREFFQRTTK